MKTRGPVLVVGAALSMVLAQACSSAAPGKSPPETSQSAPPPNGGSVGRESLSDSLALAVVKDLRIPGGTKHLKALGFESEDEMSRATVEAPLPVYRVPLARVRSFDEAADPGAVLVDARLELYPVSSAGVVVSGVTLSTAGSLPRVVSVGRGHLASALSQAREAVAGRAAGGERPFAVELSDLGAWYVGHHDAKGGLWLTPVRADERVPGSVPLESMPAARVFASLKPYSRAMRDQPVPF